MTNDLEFTDKDIEVALRYLKYYDPENVTPENAISLLEDLHKGYHDIAHHQPDRIIELQKKIDAAKKSKNIKNS